MTTNETPHLTCADCGSRAHRQHPSHRRGAATATTIIDNPEEHGESAVARLMREEDRRAAIAKAR